MRPRARLSARVLGILLAAAVRAAAADGKGEGDGPQIVSGVHPARVGELGMALLAEGAAHASADGRFVAFVSRGTNLVAGQRDEVESSDVFLRDRLRGETTLVSHAPGAALTALGGGHGPVFVSPEGGYVLFSSRAAALVEGQVDGNGGPDLFLWERATGATRLVSHAAGQPAAAASLGHTYGLGVSTDGRYVYYVSSAPNLVAGQVDTNQATDIFLWDRLAGASVLVSHAAGAPLVTGSAPSDFGRPTPDGEFLVFDSTAENLVAGQVDEYAVPSVFLFSRQRGESALVSHARGAPQVARSGVAGALSHDGRYVAFASTASDLLPGQDDRNRDSDIFLWDRDRDAATLASHRPGQPLTTPNSFSRAPSLSADGRWLAFLSAATDLGGATQDDNGQLDVYLFDRERGAAWLVSQAAGTTRSGNEECWDPSVSADGRFVVFTSQAGDLVPGQVDAGFDDDVFVYETASHRLRLASHLPASPQGAGSGLFPSISADGSTVVFTAFGRELASGLPHGELSPTDVFAYEVDAQGVSTISASHPDLPMRAALGNLLQHGGSRLASDDGRFVVFSSLAEDLVPGMAGVNGSNIYRHDRQEGTTRLVSHRAGAALVPGSRHSFLPTVSADGAFVAYASTSRDLVPDQTGTFFAYGVFLYEAATGLNTLVSRQAGSPSRVGNHESWSPVISADGRFVAFRSQATDLIPRQADNAGVDVFLYDRLSGTNTLVSHRHDSATRGTGTCFDAFLCTDTLALSRDGGILAYTSASTLLVPGQADGNGGHDVFLYERATGTNRLASRAAASPTRAGSGPAQSLALSGDGRYVAFGSQGTDHVAGQDDANGGLSDVFLYDRQSGATRLVSRAAGSPTRTADGPSFEPALDQGGAAVAFASLANDLVAGLHGPAGQQVFVFDAASGLSALVSHAPGAPRQRAAGDSGGARLSAAGQRVAYASTAADLVPGQQDAEDTRDAFLYDRSLAATLLASHLPGQPERAGNRASERLGLSADGHTLYFDSQASDLAPGDHNYVASALDQGTDPLFDGRDVFVFWLNHAPAALAQSVALREDTTRAIVLAGADPDGDGLAYALASVPSHGTLAGTPPHLTYRPAPDYHGPDSFTFTVSDGRQASPPAAVALEVAPDTAVAAADAAVVEGDLGAATLVFTVTAFPPPEGPLTVAYRTADGTAAAGSDYAAAAGTLSFAAGETRRTVAVAVSGDTDEEESETLALQLTSAAGGDVGDAEARGEITDDDDAGCARPPRAEIGAPASLCRNRSGLAAVPDAGAGAGYAWTVAGGEVTAGAGTAQIAFGAAAEVPLGLSVTVTNASGCQASGSAQVEVGIPCYAFHALKACRVADTRGTAGATGGPALEAGQVRTFPVAGSCTVPADAVAVAFNVTVAAPTHGGSLRLFPGGAPVPLASVLGFDASRARAGLALIPLGPGGGVSVQCDMPAGSGGQAHLVLDAYGYFR